MINKLDLGGTACYESLKAVNISLDGSDSGDEVTPAIIGDYNHMPFKSNTFREALGSCYLEDTYDPKELHRILRPKAKVIVKACDDFKTQAKFDKWADKHIEAFQSAGFELIERAVAYYDSDDKRWYIDSAFIFKKEG